MNVHMNNVSAVALVDSSATGVFMHPDFAKRCNATIRLKITPWEVRVIDGRIISSELITHEATVDLTVDDQQEKRLADITNTGRYDCILAPLGLSAIIQPSGGLSKRCCSTLPIANIRVSVAYSRRNATRRNQQFIDQERPPPPGCWRQYSIS